MTRSIRHFCRLCAVVAVLLLASLAATGPAAAEASSPADADPAIRVGSGSHAPAADQAMRMDRQARVLEATGYQTLTVAAVAAGAAVAGGLAAGATGAIVGGSAIVLLYLFMR